LATYLDFEQNIRHIQEEIIAAEVRYDHHAVAILKEELDKEVEKPTLTSHPIKSCSWRVMLIDPTHLTIST
jgi:hypothetical protein